MKFACNILMVCLVSVVLPNAQATAKHGYLAPLDAPDSLALLPPPPVVDSAAFSSDEEAYKHERGEAGSVRIATAIDDADYKHIGMIFSRAFGVSITPEGLPSLSRLLEKARFDSHDGAVASAKKYYQRVRPFVFYKTHSCTPWSESKLAKSGSYPSGHATYGWAVALLLSEVNPQRQDELLKRGYAYGQSRVVCGAHWQSDVSAGRVMGAAIVAALHGDQEFLHDLDVAKREFAAIKASEMR